MSQDFLCALWLLKHSPFVLLSTTEDTSATGCDQSDFCSRWARSRSCGWMANVLMITSSVRVLNWVHCRTADFRPAVALDPVLVEVIASLEHRLIHAPTSSDNTDNCTACGWYRLS